MRKTLLAIGVLSLLVGPIASAQAQTTGLRDPFDPLLTVETADGTTTGTPTGTDTDIDDPTVLDDPAAPSSDDELPATGADSTNWLAAAYVLVALGAGLVATARLLRPAERRLRI